MPGEASIVANLERVRANIDRAARKAGRRPEEVRLVAVTKEVPPEMVLEAVRAGVTDLGENRVQEGAAKRQAVESALAAGAGPGVELRWHLIGHLQTNKAARAVRSFHLIHSVDSLRVAQALSSVVLRQGPGAAEIEVLLEVNVAGEKTKFGVPPEQLPDLVRETSRLPGLRVRGLMTVAPVAADPEEVRPVFRRMAALKREIEGLGLPGVSMDYLSMGMSQDYEVAVAEGANLVRIGTAIFGPREGRIIG